MINESITTNDSQNVALYKGMVKELDGIAYSPREESGDRMAEILIELRKIVNEDLAREMQRNGAITHLATLWILGMGAQPKELNDMTGKSYRDALLDIIATPGFSWMKWQSEYRNKCDAEDLKNSFGEKKSTDVSVMAL